jgi:hypothetical protein
MRNINIAKRAGSAATSSRKLATDHSVGRLAPAPREVPRMIGPTRLAECQKVADRYAPGSTSTLMGALSTSPQDRRADPTLVEPALAPPDVGPETHGRFQIAAATSVGREGS